MIRLNPREDGPRYLIVFMLLSLVVVGTERFVAVGETSSVADWWVVVVLLVLRLLMHSSMDDAHIEFCCSGPGSGYGVTKVNDRILFIPSLLRHPISRARPIVLELYLAWNPKSRILRERWIGLLSA